MDEQEYEPVSEFNSDPQPAPPADKVTPEEVATAVEAQMQLPPAAEKAPAQPPGLFSRLETAVFGTFDRLVDGAARLLHALVGGQQNRPVTATASPQVDPDQLPATRRQKHLFYWIGLLALIIDQMTKLIVEALLPLGESYIPVAGWFPYFQFSHVANTGMAFGLFQGSGAFFSTLAVIVSFFIARFNYQLPTRSRWIRIAFGMVFGGALGNAIDRFRLGHVTDFFNFNLRPLIDWPILDWPVFNMADLFVVSGLIWLIYLMAKEIERERRAEQQLYLEAALQRLLPQILPDILAEMAETAVTAAPAETSVTDEAESETAVSAPEAEEVPLTAAADPALPPENGTPATAEEADDTPSPLDEKDTA